MGSVIALDTLFPQNAAFAATVPTVHTLVTIGSPFDAIRTYWPGYFSGRQLRADLPQRFLNFYAPADILGSSFAQAPSVDRAASRTGLIPMPEVNQPYDTGVRYSDAALMEVLTFVGFRVHANYWEEVGGGNVTCFYLVMPALYELTAPVNAKQNSIKR